MLAEPLHAQSVADFYRGKNVALAISFSPGGGYDLYARTLARHMSKHPILAKARIAIAR